MPNHHNRKKKHKQRISCDNLNNNNYPSSDKTEEALSCEFSDNQSELKIHPGDGTPYKSKYSDIFGRYLVAARDLQRSEVVIQQLPLVIGPCADENVPICLGCYTSISEVIQEFKCPGCKFLMCSNKCGGYKKASGHTVAECKSFKDHSISSFLTSNDKKENQQIYEAILTLRCLLLKEEQPERWKRINEMEAHNEIRKEIPTIWQRNQKAIVERIINQWKYNQFTADEIHTICGILEVNSFEVGQAPSRARALYAEAYLFAHDCQPNTTHTDDPCTYQLTVRTTKNLKKDEIITLSYSYTLQGTLKRREHLHDCKFFWCCCDRCKDPKELGTNCSTLLCPKCKDGHILSTNTLNQDAEWKCSKCDYKILGKLVLNLLNNLYDELEKVDGNDIEGYEKFLAKYRNVLHQNHYIFLSVKHNLTSLYGKSDGYLINEMTIEMLKHKEKYCREFLEIVNILEPGYSRLRGVVIYELHAPVMVQITRECESGKMNNDDLKRRLKEVIGMLRECSQILEIEPRGSPENIMAIAAKDALRKIGRI